MGRSRPPSRVRQLLRQQAEALFKVKAEVHQEARDKASLDPVPDTSNGYRLTHLAINSRLSYVNKPSTTPRNVEQMVPTFSRLAEPRWGRKHAQEASNPRLKQLALEAGIVTQLGTKFVQKWQSTKTARFSEPAEEPILEASDPHMIRQRHEHVARLAAISVGRNEARQKAGQDLAKEREFLESFKK